MQNYKSFSSSFIRLLRGEETQISFSEKMGYGFNIASRWENGQKRFLWEDFIELSKHCDWDVAAILEDITHSTYSKYPDSVEVINTILINDIALRGLEKIFSPQKLRRLRLGTVRLQFTEYLKILDTLYGVEERFLRFLVEPEKIKVLYEELGEPYNVRFKYRKIVADDPVYAMIVKSLKLGSYRKLKKHSDKFISKLVRVPEDQVDFRIKHLLNENIIIHKDEKYEPFIRDDNFDLGLGHEDALIRVSDLWREKLFLKGGAGTKAHHACYFYTSNKELDKKVFDLAKFFFRDVQKITGEVNPDSTEHLSYFSIDVYDDDKKN